MNEIFNYFKRWAKKALFHFHAFILLEFLVHLTEVSLSLPYHQPKDFFLIECLIIF